MNAAKKRQQADDDNRIRVLHVLEATTGGTERHLCDLLDGIDRARFLPSAICAIRRDRHFRATVERFQADGIAIVEVDMVRGLNPVADLRATHAIRRHFAQTCCDVLHLHSAKAGFLGRLAARSLGRRGVVYTPHGYPFQMAAPPPMRWLYRRLEQIAARWTDTTICVSRRELALAHGLRPDAPPASAVYIPNGVPLPETIDRQSARTGLEDAINGRIPTTTPVVGCLGRLCAQKGLDNLIRAWPGISATCPAAELVLIGDGEARPELETLADRLGVRNRIHFVGHRDNPAALLAAFDILAMPSRWEGLPYTLLDAMARALPIVASNIGGIPDAVADGVSGLLTSPDDAPALGHAIRTLLANPSLATKLGQAARSTVRERFTLTRMLEQTEAVYARIANARVGPGTDRLPSGRSGSVKRNRSVDTL